MNFGIPNCYDPAEQEARRDLAYTARIMQRPRCLGCGIPITTDLYLDLEPFGIQGLACEQCRNIHTHSTDNLEAGYE